MRLFLASMGVRPETATAFVSVVGRPPSEASVAFVPTAADPYDDRWFVDATRDEIRALGYRVSDVDLKEHDAASLRTALRGHDLVFVNGGNTFYLLREARRSGFGVVLREYLEEGGAYGGASAGSILVGPSVEIAGFGPSGDANDVGETNLAGFGFVPFCVWPHLTEEEASNVRTGAAGVSYPVVAINDRQAVTWTDGVARVVGPGKSLRLNGFV